jgi:uroporphyrinogen-III synthase
MGELLVRLVRSLGGEAMVAPAVREEPKDAGTAAERLLELLSREPSSFVVFSTGVGVEALFRGANERGIWEKLGEALRGANVVCRGPKPLAALTKLAIPARARTRSPHTTAQLLETMEPLAVGGCTVAVVHYGERNEALTGALVEGGARIHDVVVYEWRLPEDLGPLRDLVERLTGRNVDAVAFTSQIQARHLFHVAEDMGLADTLRASLQSAVVVAAVGPTCASALRKLGVNPHVVPENPKLVSLLVSLADYVAQRRQNHAGPFAERDSA